MKMHRWKPIVLTAAAVVTMSGCADDQATDQKPQPSSESAPQDDGRKLADWAAVTFLNKHSTKICEVGSESLTERFGKNGWCEQNAAFKETPTKLDLIGTCDATKAGGKTAPGTLYAYHVDPSITVVADRGSEGGVIVTVNEEGGKWVVNDLYTTSLDPSEPVIGSCPYGGFQPLEESITLG